MFKPLQRHHFFEGKLLTADDLNGEQEYILDRFRRHNRALHGFGIIEGLEVDLTGGTHLVICPGMALDCLGNEIVLEKAGKLKLPSASEKSVYVGIYFKEEKISVAHELPAPVQDCMDSFNVFRFKESYRLEWLSEDPCGHKTVSAKFPATCGKGHAVTLARLILKKGKWGLDKKFCRILARR